MTKHRDVTTEEAQSASDTPESGQSLRSYIRPATKNTVRFLLSAGQVTRIQYGKLRTALRGLVDEVRSEMNELTDNSRSKSDEGRRGETLDTAHHGSHKRMKKGA